jgi:eukaryotic-like serine/threonine-protein kinase
MDGGARVAHIWVTLQLEGIKGVVDKPERVRFGGFDLDRRSGELLKSGSRRRLQERPLRILEALLERPGIVVTRDELRRRLWSDDTFVDFDNGLNSAINRLRVSLGDNAEKPRFIETVGRRGYRFIAPVTTADDPVAATANAPSPAVGSVPMRLAVLPFRQLTADPDTEFLVFSLADAIASSLSGLESLTVRSTVASARFVTEEPDLAAIAEALDVTLVLAGTVLRVGDRVRVSTQLLEAPRGTLLWTSTADTSLSDLFQLSDALVRRIVESLSLPLSVRDSRALSQSVPASGQAYELYLRANGLGRYPTTWTQARDLYLESIRADPDYAPAWARLGRIYRLIAKYGNDDEQQMTPLAEESLRRALAINPELSLAHYLYAQLEVETGRSLEALVRLIGRVGERRADPQIYVALVQTCRYVGLLDESRAAHQHAARLERNVKTSIAFTSFMAGDPAQAVADARANADPLEGLALAAVGRTGEAVRVLEATLRSGETNETWTRYFELFLAFARGDAAAAARLVDVCLRLPFRDPEGLFFLVILMARLSDLSRALEALRSAVDAGFACLPGFECDPALEALLALPDFEELRGEVERRHQRAAAAFVVAGGHDVLEMPASSR